MQFIHVYRHLQSSSQKKKKKTFEAAESLRQMKLGIWGETKCIRQSLPTRRLQNILQNL